VLCDARDGLPISQITIRAHDDRIVRPGELIWRERSDLAEDQVETPLRAAV
jgi:hypothetical protein